MGNLKGMPKVMLEKEDEGNEMRALVDREKNVLCERCMFGNK
jgi:hypothetical protein